MLGTTRAPGASAVTPTDGAGPLQEYHQRVRLEFVERGRTRCTRQLLGILKSGMRRNFFRLFKSKSNQITDCYSSEDQEQTMRIATPPQSGVAQK
jgi:hypothetical protein